MWGGGGGGRGRYSNIRSNKLESKLLTGQEVSITLKSGVQNCDRALEWMMQ